VDKRVFMLLDYKGPKEAGLAWFFLALPRMPLTRSDVFWKDELPAEMSLSRLNRFVFDLAEPILDLARLKTNSTFRPAGDAYFAVETELKQSGLLSDKSKDGLRLVSRFDRQQGLASLVVYKGSAVVVELHQIDDNKNDE